jgi:hypothetical protein
MFKEYEPNPIIVLRACQLWSDALAKPKYDNGDPSFTGFMTKSLVESLPSNASEEILFHFRKELAGILNVKWKYEGSLGNSTLVESKEGHYQDILGVDYGPDCVLRMAAERAGLKMEFPWKSRMNLYADHLSCGWGYGAAWANHYPLDETGTRWLVTSLTGSEEDIAKVIKSVNDGNPLGLTVDEG